MKPINPEDFRSLGKAVIQTEMRAIADLLPRIDANFAKACEILLACEGRIVVTGLGKSGHIGHKIAATLASTGSPAFFVHSGEASHGDLGMITPKDVVLMVSNSGNTEEILAILPLIKRLNVPLVAMTGNPESDLAKACHVHLNVSVQQEACPLGLAPTSSTTAALVMGDALAIALLQARGFTAEDFARSHPKGILGRRLLLLIDDVMRKNGEVPIVSLDTNVSDALVEIMQKNLGMTCVVNAEGQLKGVFTDGDLRRVIDKGLDVHNITMQSVMTSHCKTVEKGMLAVDALNLMKEHRITALIVVQNHCPVGVIHLHDLLRAGV